jgi:hypothetical protein
MSSLENQTQEQRESAALRKLFNHPEFGREAKRLYKKVEPTAKFDEIELEDKIAAEAKKQQEKIESLEQQMMERDVRDRRAANHRMIEEAGLSVEAVEKVMTEEKILKYETAINYLKGQSALAPPTPQNVTPIRMPDNMAEIQKNPSAWARGEAFKAINELRAKR